MEKQLNILYVDDEQLNLELFSIVFNNKFHVITATSGQEGLQKLDEHEDIAVVISDMRMPEMNGIEFISNAKKKFANLYYFILTGFEINEEIADALKQKLIDRYFKKPFNSKEIEQTIYELVDIK
jgi:response regulator RpfG family c-di-GMP phosphodiesterase